MLPKHTIISKEKYRYTNKWLSFFKPLVWSLLLFLFRVLKALFMWSWLCGWLTVYTLLFYYSWTTNSTQVLSQTIFINLELVIVIIFSESTLYNVFSMNCVHQGLTYICSNIHGWRYRERKFHFLSCI